MAISCTVTGEEAKRQLEKLLAYENAIQECQKAIAPIGETGTIIDYLKACCSLGLETAISRSVFGEAKRELEKLFALQLSLSLIWIAYVL